MKILTLSTNLQVPCYTMPQRYNQQNSDYVYSVGHQASFFNKYIESKKAKKKKKKGKLQITKDIGNISTNSNVCPDSGKETVLINSLDNSENLNTGWLFDCIENFPAMSLMN